jgi:hypothetical protein
MLGHVGLTSDEDVCQIRFITATPSPLAPLHRPVQVRHPLLLQPPNFPVGIDSTALSSTFSRNSFSMTAQLSEFMLPMNSAQEDMIKVSFSGSNIHFGKMLVLFEPWTNHELTN